MPIFGAKSRAARGCASKLACGRRIVPAEQTDFTEVYGKSATFFGPMCTGKRWAHIRNAPSSRTAVTGIGPYTDSACLVPLRENQTFLTYRRAGDCRKTFLPVLAEDLPVCL